MHRRAFLQTGLAATAWSMGHAARPSTMAAAPPPTRRSGPIRLNSNENPLGIAPAARRAIVDTLGEANRYPRDRRTELEAVLARQHGLSPEHIVLGAGSTEILRIAVDAMGPVGGRLVVAEPTFEDVPRYAEAVGLRVDAVPLRDDLAHDVERMAALTAAPGPVLVYLCNPNNPTGTITPGGEIDALIAAAPARVQFMIDEAYIDYVTDPAFHSALHWVPERPNVVVVRTFSKIHGMAGLRLGYGIGHPATIERLGGFVTRNSANHVALVAARASLDDHAFARRSLEVNARGKQTLVGCLDELGLTHLPSHANFVFHRIDGDLETYNARMQERGIRVGRPFPPMLQYSRVSIGLPAEMETFVEALRSFRRQGWV